MRILPFAVLLLAVLAVPAVAADDGIRVKTLDTGLRIVVKEGFSQDMADTLPGDLERVMKLYESQPGHTAREAKTTGKVRC